MASKGAVLVTGGAGYIGSHAVLELKRQGERVVVIDDLSTGHAEFAAFADQFYLQDIGGRSAVVDILQREEVKAVMHFAAQSLVELSTKEPREYWRRNLECTKALLDAMVDAEVLDIIFSSTAAVYGMPECVPISEEAEIRPINCYGRTKAAIEWLLSDYAHAYGLRYVALRYFNAAGAESEGRVGEWHEPETHLIPRIVRMLRDVDADFKVFGNDYDTQDGTAVRDYVHVCDIANAHVLALKYLVGNGENVVLNLGSGGGHSVLQIIGAIEGVLGKKVDYGVEGRRQGDPAILVADNQKAKTILGWELRFSSVEEIVESAWRWESRLEQMMER